MSFWFFGRKVGNRRSLYSVSGIIVGTFLFITLILPVVDYLKRLFLWN